MYVLCSSKFIKYLMLERERISNWDINIAIIFKVNGRNKYLSQPTDCHVCSLSWLTRKNFRPSDKFRKIQWLKNPELSRIATVSHEKKNATVGRAHTGLKTYSLIFTQKSDSFICVRTNDIPKHPILPFKEWSWTHCSFL